jgi:endothelin-converting enzyme
LEVPYFFKLRILLTFKVASVRQRVGYQTANPNVADPKDIEAYYADLRVTNKSYFDMGRSFVEFNRKVSWTTLLKPTDLHRWSMTPPTVNANYHQTLNAISFPAGILQFPFFGPELPEYVSFGAFGSVAGHELSHAFDTNGARFDERGAYREWWDNGTMSRFKTKANCFVEQYSKYSITDDEGKPMHVNGKLTLRENIADAGGVSASFAAWKKRNDQKQNPGLPGLERFTNEQLFFMSFAGRRCSKTRPAQAVKNILTDAHSPNEWRIIGTLQNSAPFKEAFNCPVKKPECEIW